MYHEFAKWYDKMMRSVDYDNWVAYIISIIEKYNCRSIYECGCGTGNIAIRLARKGYSVVASDISEYMLVEARNKMMKNGLRFPLLQQDMSSINIHKPVDAIVSACDGVNYLTDSPDAFFASAYHALKPGGVLLFDVSSQYKLTELLKNSSFCDTGDDWAYICDCENTDNSELLNMYLTCFVKEGHGYRRFEERHTQRAYSADYLIQLLKKRNYTQIFCYDWNTFSLPKNNSQRIQFVALKPLDN